MAEVVNNGGNFTFQNYNVSASKGSLYQSSKVEKDGYEEVITQSGTKTYHRYVKSVTGYVTKVAVNTANFPSGAVEQLVVNVTDRENGVIQVIQMPLHNSKGNYSTTALAMLNVLPNLDKDKEVAVGFYLSKYTTKSGDEKTNVVASISYLGETTEDGKPLNVKWIDFSEVPMGEKVEKRGTVTWNFDKRDDFYYDLLQKVIERFRFENGESQPTSTKKQNTNDVATNTTATQTDAFSSDDDDEELPF